MKNMRIAVLVCLITAFGIQYAQAQDTKKTQIEQKIGAIDAPNKVKEALKSYAGYEISKEATITQKSGNKKVYTFKLVKGNWTTYLMIDHKGKVLGLRNEE
ncbi:hypothetical protein MWU59_09670 [Flavobacteriaceae bacterium F08102]|nr:hypothetical protein [Flavobacteriaceae bacterium F08102]